MTKMNSAYSVLSKNISDAQNALKALSSDSEFQLAFNSAIECAVRCYTSGGRVLIAGNGGSAADAQHLAAEFVSKLARDRAPLPAEALTTDTSILTAIGNDYGYEKVFSRQLEGKARLGDIFLAITTSGNSKNIQSALQTCRLLDVRSILLTGRDGGICKELADICMIVPGGRTSTIQELHILVAHTLCEFIEISMFG